MSSDVGRGVSGDETGSDQAGVSDGGLDGQQVESVPLSEIDFGDETYMFRAHLRVGDLKKSIAVEGLQLPIIVRKRGHAGSRCYQIISGFRRAKAIRELGGETIAAIVRDDLDDAAAFKASVLENTARKSYSDIDRAIVARRYRQQGHTAEEAGRLMGLTGRQVKNLELLLKLPAAVQEAVDDLGTRFSAKHAFLLRRYANKHPDLDYAFWVREVARADLSASQLTRALNRHCGGQYQARFASLFQRSGTDWERGHVRFAPVKVSLYELSDDERQRLREELDRLLETLGPTP